MRIVRRRSESEEGPTGWKTSYREQTVPSPSVMYTNLNLRHEFKSLSKLKLWLIKKSYKI